VEFAGRRSLARRGRQTVFDVDPNWVAGVEVLEETGEPRPAAVARAARLNAGDRVPAQKPLTGSPEKRAGH
jgi:hypothetical protein